MPKKGSVVCRSCNKTFAGKLPDHLPVGDIYTSTEGEIDISLVKRLQRHHFDTQEVRTRWGGLSGHKEYDVFLNDGSKGELEANSYCVTYTERG